MSTIRGRLADVWWSLRIAWFRLDARVASWWYAFLIHRADTGRFPMLARIRVVLTAAVTWLVAAGSVVSIVLAELGQVPGIPDGVFRVLGTVATVIAVAVAIIRRSTPVLPAARGLMPPPPYVPVTERERSAGVGQVSYRTESTTNRPPRRE